MGYKIITTMISWIKNDLSVFLSGLKMLPRELTKLVKKYVSSKLEYFVNFEDEDTPEQLTFLRTQDGRTIHGLIIIYEESGEIDRKIIYRRGTKHGPASNYHYKGNIMREFSYKDGKLDGLSKEYYQNGKLELEEFYEDGTLNGEHKSWHKDGRPNYQGTYKNGKKIGPFIKWYYEDIHDPENE